MQVISILRETPAIIGLFCLRTVKFHAKDYEVAVCYFKLLVSIHFYSSNMHWTRFIPNQNTAFFSHLTQYANLQDSVNTRAKICKYAITFLASKVQSMGIRCIIIPFIHSFTPLWTDFELKVSKIFCKNADNMQNILNMSNAYWIATKLPACMLKISFQFIICAISHTLLNPFPTVGRYFFMLIIVR